MSSMLPVLCASVGSTGVGVPDETHSPASLARWCSCKDSWQAESAGPPWSSVSGESSALFPCGNGASEASLFEKLKSQSSAPLPPSRSAPAPGSLQKIIRIKE